MIEKVDGPNHIKVVEEFGYEMYLHCGAIRKVLLAYQSPSFIEEYVNKIIEHDHAFPRVDAGDLRDELKKIRQSGYAITYGEYVNDAVGIGAPVFNSEGELAGSIGIIAPTIRLNSEELLKVQLEYVQKFAAESFQGHRILSPVQFQGLNPCKSRRERFRSSVLMTRKHSFFFSYLNLRRQIPQPFLLTVSPVSSADL